MGPCFGMPIRTWIRWGDAMDWTIRYAWLLYPASSDSSRLIAFRLLGLSGMHQSWHELNDMKLIRRFTYGKPTKEMRP